MKYRQLTKEQLELNESMYPLGYGDPIDIAWSTAYLLSLDIA